MKKQIRTALMFFMLLVTGITICGCSGKVDSPVKKEAAAVNAPEAEDSETEKPATEEIEPEASETEASGSQDNLTTISDVLDSYMKDPEKKDLEYVMFDVNADGIEELFFMRQGQIAEIYGTRNDKPIFSVICPETLDLTLYPKGMLRAKSNEKAEGDKDLWLQYFPEWGDFLSVFEETEGEYYTFCAYDLDDESLRQVNASLADIDDYPVWIYEWFEMISKEDYELLVPKDAPVKLPESYSLSDRDALDVLPEYLLYVNASDGYANLRTGPGTEYDVICKVPNGGELEVYKKSATSKSGTTWRKVIYFTETDDEDGYAWLTGWMADSQLE
ncbi:MAG: SH3 domain-containing protein [Lachnospiraceae bacterium]|nr:SH3 domain-containing protein [Lachnospiraceae bacterium]